HVRTRSPCIDWSDSRYLFHIQEDCNGNEAIQARRDRREAAPGRCSGLAGPEHGGDAAFGSKHLITAVYRSRSNVGRSQLRPSNPLKATFSAELIAKGWPRNGADQTIPQNLPNHISIQLIIHIKQKFGATRPDDISF